MPLIHLTKDMNENTYDCVTGYYELPEDAQ
jgi:hypothetical protein